MILIDTNILIYASKGVIGLEPLIQSRVAYSSATKIEALGYPELPANELGLLLQLFGEYEHLPITNFVIDQAIAIRQLRKLKLGDAIIAATALVHNLELWTANTDDFKHIIGLKIHSPYC